LISLSWDAALKYVLVAKRLADVTEFAEKSKFQAFYDSKLRLLKGYGDGDVIMRRSVFDWICSIIRTVIGGYRT